MQQDLRILQLTGYTVNTKVLTLQGTKQRPVFTHSTNDPLKLPGTTVSHTSRLTYLNIHMYTFFVSEIVSQKVEGRKQIFKQQQQFASSLSFTDRKMSGLIPTMMCCITPDEQFEI